MTAMTTPVRAALAALVAIAGWGVVARADGGDVNSRIDIRISAIFRNTSMARVRHSRRKPHLVPI